MEAIEPPLVESESDDCEAKTVAGSPTSEKQREIPKLLTKLTLP